MDGDREPCRPIVPRSDSASKSCAPRNSPALRDALISDHLWLARHGARRFAGRGEARDDLTQVASLALVNAVDRFDPEMGVRFATYAMPTIVGELRRHFRDRSWSVRVARRLKDLHVELRSAKEELTHHLGRAPTVDELADFVDATPDEVLEALEAGAAYRAGTLSTGPVGADGQELEEPAVLGTDDEELDAAPDRVEVQRALQTLPERDRQVVYLSFYAGLTQSEIAEEVGRQPGPRVPHPAGRASPSSARSSATSSRRR